MIFIYSLIKEFFELIISPFMSSIISDTYFFHDIGSVEYEVTVGL